MDVFAKVSSALKNMGFRCSQVTRVLAELREARVEPELEPLVRAALARLAPAPVSSHMPSQIARSRGARNRGAPVSHERQVRAESEIAPASGAALLVPNGGFGPRLDEQASGAQRRGAESGAWQLAPKRTLPAHAECDWPNLAQPGFWSQKPSVSGACSVESRAGTEVARPYG